MSTVMARRLGGVTPRRGSDSDDSRDPTESTSPRAKSQSSPYLSVCLLVVGILFIIGYNSGHSSHKYHGGDSLPQGGRRIDLISGGDVSRHISTTHDSNLHIKDDDDVFSDFLSIKDGNSGQKPECGSRICAAIPILQEIYGILMHRTLHMGPGTCGVVSKIREEEGNEVWGIQPFEMRKPVHKLCQRFIKRGIVRVGDPSKIPYRAKSFSFVLVTGTLEKMSSKELNQTLIDLARVCSNRLVLIVGNVPRSDPTKKIQKPLKPRNRSWWQRRLQSVGLEEDQELEQKFESLQAATTFRTNSNIFHLRVPGAK